MCEPQMPVVLGNNYSNSPKINKIRFSTVLATHREHREELEQLPPLQLAACAPRQTEGTDETVSAFLFFPQNSLFPDITVPSPLNTICYQLHHETYFLEQCTTFIIFSFRKEKEAETQELCRRGKKAAANVGLVYGHRM